ncbi:MAG: phage minor capsid protein [Bacteroidales bacterium]|nr:phage minor capsid protein [Bacteroidales bacterium]
MKPQELEAIPQAFESKMRELQLRIMEDIVRRLRKNAGEVTAAAAWQMQRAYELGVSKQALRQLLEQVAVELETQVDEVYDSRLANVYSADRQRYKAAGKPFIEYAENKELQQLISAVKAQTKDEFRNITQSMGFALPSGENGKIEFHPIADYYQQTLDGAVMDIASGAFDYNTVLKRITNEMTNSGVRTVAYASGHTDRIEVAARRAVMTGFHQVVAKKAEQDMAALDTNYVEVTWHHGARPTHQVWQGKVYFWDRGFEDSLAEPPETLDNSGESGIIDLEDIPIGRSLGAKAKNYDIMDLQTGESFKFAEGTKLQNVQVFAGKGSKTVFRKAQKYADKYGGEAKDWQHVKGFGVIDFYGEDRKAEVHWVQCENIGKHDFFIKEWLE